MHNIVIAKCDTSVNRAKHVSLVWNNWLILSTYVSPVVTTFDKLSKQLLAPQQISCPSATLTQQTSAIHSKLWPGGDKLYIEFNALKQTLALQTSASCSKRRPSCDNIWHTTNIISCHSSRAMGTSNWNKWKAINTGCCVNFEPV